MTTTQIIQQLLEQLASEVEFHYSPDYTQIAHDTNLLAALENAVQYLNDNKCAVPEVANSVLQKI